MYAASIHESGHAVVGEALGFPVCEVAISRSDAGVWSGWTRFDFGDTATDVAEARPSGITASAGLTLPDRERQAIGAAMRDALGSDERVVNYLALSYAGRLAGLRTTGGLRATCGADDSAAEALILEAFGGEAAQKAFDRARAIAAHVLTVRWCQVQTLALELVARERLTGDEVRATLEGG